MSSIACHAPMVPFRAMALFAATLTTLLATRGEAQLRPESHQAFEQALAKGAPTGFVLETTLDSASVATNQLGASGRVAVVVHATAGWTACQTVGTPCRVVLFLPGFDGSPRITYLDDMFALRRGIDDAVMRGKLPPMLVVIPDPRTILGGSFYTDSPVTGRWATFILDELLPAVESALHVADAGQRRLILGHSMGGFGVLHLALLRPNAWRGAAGISPVASTHFAEGGRLRAAVTGESRKPEHLKELLATPTESFFSERLFWAMAAAWTSSDQGLDWQKALKADGRELTLPLAYVRDWARLDPVQRLGLDAAAGACALPALFLTVGSRDNIIGVADVSNLAEVMQNRCGKRTRVTLQVHDGNHGNHVHRDVLDALVELTRVPASPKAAEGGSLPR